MTSDMTVVGREVVKVVKISGQVSRVPSVPDCELARWSSSWRSSIGSSGGAMRSGGHG